MSNAYQLTFPIAFDLPGPNTKTAKYEIPLVPDPTSTTFYARHFYSATTVRVISGEVSVVVGVPDHTKAAPSGSCCFAAVGCPVTTVSGVANRRGISQAGSTCRAEFSQGFGLRRVLRGVADAGDLPAIIVMLSASWNASSVAAAGIVSGELTLEFSGMSDAAAYSEVFRAPAAK